MSTLNSPSFLQDRIRLGRILTAVGLTGVAAAFVVGGTGWILAGRAATALTVTIEPISAVVGNVGDTIDASLVMVSRTTEALDSIERATRSTARTLNSVTSVVGETSVLVGTDLADGLEAAVETLPALTDTSRIIDRTMRALSFVGVDYDPEIPLDESLSDLESALTPIPGQLRAQVELLDDVQGDIDRIALDAGDLAAVLLETRIDMMDAEQVIESAALNVDRAVENLARLESDIATFDTLGRVGVVAVTLALLAAAVGPLLVGIHLRRAPSG